MGRVDKRLKAEKRLKNEKKSLSASKVLKTLADKDKKDELVKVNTKNQVKLLLEKPTAKTISKMKAAKISKKDKMKIKKDHLHQKLDLLQTLKKEEKAAVQRQKKAIVGDLKPITDTLDKILKEDDDNKKAKKRKKLEKKDKPPVKQKQIQNQMMNNLSIFQQVLKHPEFTKDPFNTISTHIENKMLMEAME